MNAQEITDIAEKRFVQIIRKELGAIQAVPYYYNLISWLIKQVRLLPQPLTEAKNCDTMMYDDDKLLGC